MRNENLRYMDVHYTVDGNRLRECYCLSHLLAE